MILAVNAPAPESLVVQTSAVAKSFGRVHALRALTFEARGPSIFGIVGPDGAGKTTLLRVLCGLLAHDAGVVSVLGIDPRRDPLRLKPRLGYVPQTFCMYPTLSVEENLRFVARCHGLSRQDYEPRMNELLVLARLAKFTARRAENLSGGMQKKLSLVGALLARPSLIVLDEPNAGVDIDARSEFWDVLRECARSALVLLATNYLDEASRCDRMLYMAGGRALVTGTPTEVRRGAQVRVHVLRSDELTPAAIVAALAGERDLALERHERGVTVEASAASEPIEARLARLGLSGVSLERLEPTLETALLALEARARGEHEQPILGGTSGR